MEKSNRRATGNLPEQLFGAALLRACCICGLALTCLLSTAQAIAGDARQLSREDGSQISYYLEHAADSDRSGVLLVVLQGSACNSVTRIASISRHYARLLPGADVLTIEKYGLTAELPLDKNPDRPDCPQAYLENDHLLQRERDVLAVLARLSAEHDYRMRVALGGSEGASLAILLAARGELLDAAVALNPGGRFFRDDVLHSMRATIPDEGALEQAQQGFGAFASEVTDGEPFPVEMSGHGYRWWRSMLQLDQLAALERVTLPLLVVQGGKDNNVDPDGPRRMIEQLGERERGQVEFSFYPQLDHGFREPGGGDKTEEVLADVRRWVLALPAPRL